VERKPDVRCTLRNRAGWVTLRALADKGVAFTFSRPPHDVDLENVNGHASHQWSDDMTERREGGGQQIRVKVFDRDWIFEEGSIEDYLSGRRPWPSGGSP